MLHGVGIGSSLSYCCRIRAYIRTLNILYHIARNFHFVQKPLNIHSVLSIKYFEFFSKITSIAMG